MLLLPKSLKGDQLNRQRRKYSFIVEWKSLLVLIAAFIFNKKEYGR